MIDLDKPALKEHLRRRTSEGRYEISDIDLVLNIRARKEEILRLFFLFIFLFSQLKT